MHFDAIAYRAISVNNSVHDLCEPEHSIFACNCDFINVSRLSWWLYLLNCFTMNHFELGHIDIFMLCHTHWDHAKQCAFMEIIVSNSNWNSATEWFVRIDGHHIIAAGPIWCTLNYPLLCDSILARTLCQHRTFCLSNKLNTELNYVFALRADAVCVLFSFRHANYYDYYRCSALRALVQRHISKLCIK